MRLARRFLVPLISGALLGALPAVAADGPVCSAVTKVPLERHLRQLSLDLLGRPPTYEEYQAARAKGEVSVEDVRALMATDDFYNRMRGYHRALLWSNITASVTNNSTTRLTGAGTALSPYSLQSTTSSALRGANGQTCDPDIAQDTCNATWQDPQAEDRDSSGNPKTAKVCRDARGVPLPVSWDYDTNLYSCTRLDQTDATVTTCDLAVSKGKLAAKYLLFCDMRRVSDGKGGFKLAPHQCLPDPAKSNTQMLTGEESDSAGRVVAFTYPSPPAGASLTRLDRCTLALTQRSGVQGTWVVQRGCLEREGYMTRPAPYWNPGGADVRMCAIEAQQNLANPWTLESCATTRFMGDRSCGCGENMRRCEAGDGSTHTARLAALNTEPELIADSVVRRDEPYFNILTTRRSFLNGPLSQLYRDSQQGVGVFALTAPASATTLPAMDFTDTTTWNEYVRDPQHSGVLTSPAYLYRFPTQRARVNHFYQAFLCKSFVPSSNRPPAPEDACNRENNLAKRCACKDCHATIEPTGAHWGRFAERGATWLDPSRFPRFDAKCHDCAVSGNVSCGGECAQYVMQAYDGDGANSLGLLSTYLYRTADEEQNIEGGPQMLVQRMMQTGALERCAVQRMWNEFLGRPMTSQEQGLYLDSFAKDFATDGYRLKGLIERLLMSDAYRRID